MMNKPAATPVRPFARQLRLTRLRQAARTAALAACAAFCFAATPGCASKPTRSGHGDGLMLLNQGASAEGGFARRGFASLNVPAPVTNVFVRGDVVFVYTKNNTVYVLSPNLDVRHVLQVAKGELTLRPPLVFGKEKQMIFPTGSALFVFAADGTFLRTTPLPAPLTTDVTLDQRDLLLTGTAAATGGRLSVIDPTRPHRVVVQETRVGTVASRPVGFQGITYVANDQGRIFAVAENSVAIWPLEAGAFRVDRPIRAELAVDDFALYAASTDGVLYAIDRANGRLKWRYIAQAPLRHSPFVTPESIYQVVPEIGLVAIDKVEGKLYRDPLWTVPGVESIASVDARNVYVSLAGGRLGAIDRKTGGIIYDVQHGFDLVALNEVDGTIYAATTDGAVMAITTSRFGTASGTVGSAR